MAPAFVVGLALLLALVLASFLLNAIAYADRRIRDDVWWQIAVAFVAVIVHRIARPVRGLGIAVAALVPPLLAAGSALIVGLT